MALNEIQAWLKAPQKDWESGTALFRKYNKHQGLYKSFLMQMGLRATKKKLIYELEKLAKKPGIEKEKIYIEPEELPAHNTTFKPKGIVEIKPEGKEIFPPRIDEAIRARSSAANKREKYRKELIDYQGANPEDRKAIMIKVREAHYEVMELHKFIKEWEKTGIVPLKSPLDQETQPDQALSTLSEEEKEQLEEEWKSWLRKRSKNRRFLKEWQADDKKDHPKRDAKIKYYMDLEEESQNQLDRLADLLGKTGLMK